MKKEKILYGIIVILLITIAVGITYIVMDNKNNNQDNTEIKENNNDSKVEENNNNNNSNNENSSSDSNTNNFKEAYDMTSDEFFKNVAKIDVKSLNDVKEIYNQDSKENSFMIGSKKIDVSKDKEKASFTYNGQEIANIPSHGEGIHFSIYDFNNNMIILDRFVGLNLEILDQNFKSLFNDIVTERPSYYKNKLYYLSQECTGTRTDGVGNVDIINEFDSDKQTIKEITNLDHDEGWAC